MQGPPLGPGGEDITWPDQVAPRGRKASSTRKIKPQTSNLKDALIQNVDKLDDTTSRILEDQAIFDNYLKTIRLHPED